MARKPAFFQMYRNYETQFSMLSNEQIGVLMRALFAYVNRDTEPDFEDLTVRVLFSFLKDNIDREFGNYDKRCEQNRKNGLRKYATAGVRTQKEEEKEKEKEEEKEKEKEEEKENSLSKPQGGLERGESEFAKSVLFSYHYFCQELPRVSKLTEKRRQAIKKALPYLDGKGFEALFQKAAQSDFLSGRKGSWKASFDWLLEPDNLTRVLEGRYDNVGSSRAPSYNIDEIDGINYM